ncbi:MAG: hypothetical protein WCU00_13415, partial [Candidatus Latescibacterota bacterium]
MGNKKAKYRESYAIVFLILNALMVLFAGFSGADTVSIPGMVTVTASIHETAPEWAVMQRRLIKTMEENAQVYLDHFVKSDGTIYGGSSNQVSGASNYDDLYEMFNNWPLFYAVGADEKILSHAIKEYNAITLMCNSSPQLYKEFPEHADWFHISEGMMLFYGLGAAEPAIPENILRAKRFADFYMGENPEARNYDSELKIIRGPFNGSKGPLFETKISNYELDPQYGWT